MTSQLHQPSCTGFRADGNVLAVPQVIMYRLVAIVVVEAKRADLKTVWAQMIMQVSVHLAVLVLRSHTMHQCVLHALLHHADRVCARAPGVQLEEQDEEAQVLGGEGEELAEACAVPFTMPTM
jgi:hypothetical protein